MWPFAAVARLLQVFTYCAFRDDFVQTFVVASGYLSY